MIYDLLIVGGGINGCAVAREAALNGMSVLLVERDDLASHTSSASTKLIHGGLRYLETYEFRLVREALHERERLLAAAPHLIRPMAFVLPHQKAIRPWWIIRAGLFIYDLLAGNSSLPRSRSLGTHDSALMAPLNLGARAFIYSDAWVDDSRFTLANAVDAAAAGATIATRTALQRARRQDGVWRAELSDGRSIVARSIVNATGPWVAKTLDMLDASSSARVRMVKGSHIVVPRLFEGDHAYILQQPDRRIVFAIPYAHRFTIVGTTDVPVDRPEDARISDEEMQYLCDAANRYFKCQTGVGEVIWAWSGIRPLLDSGESEARSVTRDYKLELDTDGAPLLSIFGGKITTARALAEEAADHIGGAIGVTCHPVTRNRPLPGGAIGEFSAFLAVVRQRWPFLGDDRSERMARAYGSALDEMLDGVEKPDDLGEELAHGLTEVELRWMRDREWARTVDDVLWRRSKLGIFGPVAENRIEQILRETQP